LSIGAVGGGGGGSILNCSTGKSLLAQEGIENRVIQKIVNIDFWNISLNLNINWSKINRYKLIGCIKKRWHELKIAIILYHLLK
jgi:hypothetical protein